MQIKLIAIGTRMPAWVNQAYQEYAQRMPKICQLNLIEIAAKKRGKNADVARILSAEADAITSAIAKQSLVIALDRRGQTIDTQGLARQQQQWIDDSQDVAVVVGGPEGLPADFIRKANFTWSLSALTFAHPLVRVMVAEQLYRAWSINAKLPYHRDD